MLGFLSEKKFLEALAKLEAGLVSRFEEIDERLARAERSERRAKAALESLADDHEAALEILRRLYGQSPPTEALLSFAENFILWRQGHDESPETDLLAKKLDALLADFGLEAVAETGIPFDQDKHEACHTRFDPDQPENAVLEVVRPGFSVGGRVLRYASVVVNRPLSPPAQGDDHA